jgi:hypothetical protein
MNFLGSVQLAATCILLRCACEYSGAARRNHLYSFVLKLLIKRIAVAGAVTDQVWCVEPHAETYTVREQCVAPLNKCEAIP